jgi:CRISPR-associated protein Cas2
MTRRLWMICYDIADDRRRRKVERVLTGRGERVQWSVFECFLAPQELARLRHSLTASIDPTTDSLRYYPLCTWCQGRVEWAGQGRRSEDPDLYIV